MTPFLPDGCSAFLDTLLSKYGQDAYALAGEFERFFVEDAGLEHDAGAHLPATVVSSALGATGDADRNVTAHDARAAFDDYRQAQRAIDRAIRMLDAKTHEKQVLLDLFLRLS